MQRNRQCKHAACTGDNQKVIDVDTYEFAALPAKKRTWIVNGTHNKRDVLLSPREWLLDTIINASPMLLKKGSGIHGFQEMTLGITLVPTGRVYPDSA